MILFLVLRPLLFFSYFFSLSLVFCTLELDLYFKNQNKRETKQEGLYIFHCKDLWNQTHGFSLNLPKFEEFQLSRQLFKLSYKAYLEPRGKIFKR